MKIIDCHVHPSAVKNYAEEFEHFISHMRSHGIGAMIASDLGDGWLAYPESDTLRRANDRLRDMSQKYTGEVFYLVYLNPQLEDWQAEFERHKASACGVKLWISLRNQADKNDLSASVNVLKAVAECQLPVLIHCFERTDGNAGGSVGIDEIIYMANQVPSCKIIAAHSNGNWRKLIAKATRVPENVFFDVSGSYPERTMVRRLVDTFGSERILYGSDAPGRSFGSQMSKVFSAKLAPQEEENILYNNCRRIFNLPEVKSVPAVKLPKWDLPESREDNFCFAGSSPFWDHAVSVAELVAQADKLQVDTLYAASLGAIKSLDFVLENTRWLRETASYCKIKALAAVDLSDRERTVKQLENMSGFAGIWVSPYLHNWSLADRSFDWFWAECAAKKINIWINCAVSDDRFRKDDLITRVVGNDEIKSFSKFAPHNQYTLQGVGLLADLSAALPENFRLECSKLTDNEYLAEQIFTGKSGCIRRLCRGSEYPFREFDSGDMVLQGRL